MSSTPGRRGARPVPRGWARLILVVVSTACAVLLAEGLARLLQPVPFDDLQIWPGFDEQLRTGFFVADRELGYRPGPAWLASGRFGFRNGAEYTGPAGSAVDIAILGDSLVQDGELGRALAERLGGTTARVWVAGIGGYNTLQEAIYLEREITLAPDVLILGFCLNDFNRSMIVVAAGSGGEDKFVTPAFEPLAEVNPVLFRHSALYRLVQSVRIARTGRSQYSPEGVRSNREAVRLGLERMRRYAARRKIPFLVILYPHLVEQEAPWLREAHRLALQIFRELGLRYVDVSDAYAARGIAALRRTRDDVVHPGREGHDIAARELLRAFPDVFDGVRGRAAGPRAAPDPGRPAP